MADTPTLFAQIAQPEFWFYLLVPRHNSSRRKYLPVGFFDVMTICGDSNVLVPDASLYHFGVLSSHLMLDA